MGKSYQVIEQSTWKRAMHCKLMRSYTQPCLYLDFEVDITNYLKYVKERGLTFTLATVHLMCRCANSIENFRYRFEDGEVVLYDECDTLFTYLDDEGELYKMVTVPMIDDMEEYVAAAKKKVGEQKAHFAPSLGNGVIRCTAIPWVSFTHLAGAYSGKPDYATPVIGWGKFHEKDGKVMMPVSVQANHCFVDGLHIGRFAQKLQETLDTFLPVH